jgi:hypothetical protein
MKRSFKIQALHIRIELIRSLLDDPQPNAQANIYNILGSLIDEGHTDKTVPEGLTIALVEFLKN